MDNNEEKVVVKLKKQLLPSERQERKNKILNKVIIVALCVLFFLTGALGGYVFFVYQHQANDVKAEKVLGEIEYILQKKWLYANEYEDLITDLEDNALYGMSEFEFDPYTSYMSKQEHDSFATSIDMNYVGIGVEYSSSSGINLVKKVFKDSPAEMAGMKQGDELIAADGKSLEGLSTSEIKELIIGEAGSQVVVTVKRNNELIDLTIYRGKVDSSVYCYAEDDYVIAELNSFGSESGDTLASYLSQYEDYKKIIINLRGNTGGYQSAVAKIAGLFIGDNKVYMKEVDKDGNEVADYTKVNKVFTNFEKIVVLIDENTASAAEVLAICLKEQHPNVTLVGTNSFGKGVMQTQYSLSNGATLKVTIAKWLSPNDVWINEVGITPDVEVKLPEIMYMLVYYMEEDEAYSIDNVSEMVEFCECALKTLGYEIDRTDGYFDESFYNALNKFKAENDLNPDGILDSDAYNAIISITFSECSSNPEYDYQMLKAKEIIREN